MLSLSSLTPAIFVNSSILMPAQIDSPTFKEDFAAQKQTFLEKLKELEFETSMVSLEIPGQAHGKLMIDVKGHDAKKLYLACKEIAKASKGISLGKASLTAERLNQQLGDACYKKGHGVKIKKAAEKIGSKEQQTLTNYFIKHANEKDRKSLITMIIETASSSSKVRFGLAFGPDSEQLTENVSQINGYDAKTSRASISTLPALIPAA